jgi:hypothetical protein
MESSMKPLIQWIVLFIILVLPIFIAYVAFNPRIKKEIYANGAFNLPVALKHLAIVTAAITYCVVFGIIIWTICNKINVVVVAIIFGFIGFVVSGLKNRNWFLWSVGCAIFPFVLFPILTLLSFLCKKCKEPMPWRSNSPKHICSHQSNPE